MRRFSMLSLATLAAFFTAWVCPAVAEVKAVVVTSRAPWLDGKPQGAAGAYEKLQGHITYAVDPATPANRHIADLQLAPRNADGKVEFSGDFVVLRPVDPARARKTVFLEVLNRGHTQARSNFFLPAAKTGFKVESLDDVKLKDAFLFEQGFTVAWVGWQFDLPKGTIRLDVPTSTAQSLFRESIFSTNPGGTEASGVDSMANSYCAADSAQPTATLTVKDSLNGPVELVPRESWSFAKLVDGKPVPDACSILLPGGFTPKRMYEAIYKGAPAPVAGLGLAAVRDFASYLKYGGVDSPLREHPETERRILGYGYSQSARFLRQFLYQGFNADERGRQDFDAMFIASAGAGRGSLNHRYAQPGEAGNSVLSDLRPADMFPFTDDHETDPVTGNHGGLLDEAKRTRTLPKIFYTYSSSEYWARVGSLAYTTVDGGRELPIDADARLYFFAGTPHAHGPFPPDRLGQTPEEHYQNFDNFSSSGWGFRALLLDLDAWASTGVQPPASVYPHLGHDLVAREKVSFPKIPALEFPGYMPQNWRMDFGPDFATKGIIGNEPPKLGKAYTVLVPQVDSDGNDLGGIALPFLAVPLGTYTGWNIELPQLASFHYLGGLIGSFQAFPRTRAERLESGDSRPSIEERYKSREDYLAKAHEAALKLVEKRLLMAGDLPAIDKENARFWDGLAGPDGDEARPRAKN